MSSNEASFQTPTRAFTDEKMRRSLLDPRSPTTDFDRTPLELIMGENAVESQQCFLEEMAECPEGMQIEISPERMELEIKEEEVELESRSEFISLNSGSMSDDWESMEDPSPQVSSLGSSMNVSPTTFVEMEVSQVSRINSESAIEGKFTFKKEEKLIKKLFVASPDKKRNPLGFVDNVFPITPPPSMDSPQFVLRQKQWKRIQEERVNLGLAGDVENTPPLPPPSDVTASAPGRLAARKRNLRGFSNRL